MMRHGVYRSDKPVAGVQVDAGSDPIQAIARALEFPDWFGGNWDALEDCLSDLSWRKASATVLVIRNFVRNDQLGILIDILRSTAQYWEAQDASFVAVFVDPKRELALPSLA